ncbi:oxidoreductase [Methyloceanibacter superfactus]|uniref:Oxidoreductase n=1 Tax=Methyloceanibacter superfactus TaxID=1774969 RepID=A0A1E3W1L8_9HYPH|nr:NAD(P)-dependent oxidoreductase [Methyloceanibacter superfactus]ODR99705.1 oxidoreductase [Methyloceanibacter superfactus]
MSKVAWIGLGVMGYPLAGHLKTHGHDVTVFNRTREKAERWVDAFGGRLAATPAEAAGDADFVFACVGNDDDLRSVTLGPDGVFQTLQSGAVFVDHTTASATIARELHGAARERGAGSLDAPVSGGQSGAESGTLTVMIGGDEDDFTKAKPVIDAYARAANLIGPSGSGQLTKMVNQICIAGLIEALAEALHFAKAANLDVEKVIDTISKGAAQSWQMDNRWRTMIEGKFDFGFAVDWVRKDFAICFDEARRNGASLPVTALVDQFYADVQEMGGNRWDTSSLIARLGRK